MIQNLKVQGYRSLKDVAWTPGRLNVVVGPNGSGKSNLLRVLSLLQQSAQGKLVPELLREGGIAPVLWDGQATELAFRLKTDPLDTDRDTQREALTYDLKVQQLGGSSAWRIEHEMLSNTYLMDTGVMAAPKKFLERTPTRAVTFDLQERQLVAREDSVPDDQPLLPLIAGPFSNPVILRFCKRVASWGIYHDIHVDRDAPIRQPAVARIEARVDADGQNLVPFLHTHYTNDRDFKRDIDDAMRVAFGTEYEELVFPPAADQRVQLRVRWQSLRQAQPAADLSDGTLRFLLLLGILARPLPGSIAAIDEPETGLHPSMLPVVAEFAQQAAESAQVILTTHSPQFLDAFDREAPPTTTVAHWSEGTTQLSVVEGAELSRWLAEFSLGALFRSRELEGLA